MPNKQVLISKEEWYPVLEMSDVFEYKTKYDVEATITEDEFLFIREAYNTFQEAQGILFRAMKNASMG